MPTTQENKSASFVIWGGFALVLGVAPLLWTSGFAQTMLSQVGIAIIACLAYNILLGQGGMLSFGHAVYSGLGSFLAIHALNLVSAGKLQLPVSLVPLVGGLSGLFFAALLGWVTTKIRSRDCLNRSQSHLSLVRPPDFCRWRYHFVDEKFLHLLYLVRILRMEDKSPGLNQLAFRVA